MRIFEPGPERLHLSQSLSNSDSRPFEVCSIKSPARSKLLGVETRCEGSLIGHLKPFLAEKAQLWKVFPLYDSHLFF